MTKARKVSGTAAARHTRSSWLAHETYDNACSTWEQIEDRAEMLALETKRYKAVAERLLRGERDPNAHMQSLTVDVLLAAGRVLVRFEDVQSAMEGAIGRLRDDVEGLIQWPGDREPGQKATQGPESGEC